MTTDQPRFQCYLYVSPEGEILANRKKRVDHPDLETWHCEYFQRSFRVTKVHPNLTEPQSLRIEVKAYQVLEDKHKEYISRKSQNARHEAGHAILFYALRVDVVEEININPGARIGDNLYDQLKRKVANSSSLFFISGTTCSPDRLAGQHSRDTRYRLGIACQGFGGLVGSRGDQTGFEGDLRLIRNGLAPLNPPRRSGSFSFDLSTAGQPESLSRLEDRLKSLAEEIMANPVVASRHEELTRQLAEKLQLNQQEVEAIVEPASLPDYSYRLEEIRKEFHLPEQF
jgi:hypothetical protein